MAWCGIIRAWDAGRRQCRQLVLCIEDTPEPGCLARLYDEGAVVGEGLADTPHEAVGRVLLLAQEYLQDRSIGAECVDGVQV